MKYLQDVEKFHRIFNIPVENSPIIPHKDRCALRVSLIQEELNELEQAIENNSIVGIADALVDICYVLNGAVLEFGLQHDWKDLWNEVQRSNMSKTCNTEDEAKATVQKYIEEREVEAYYKREENGYIVRRTSDDKILKSINYSPADLKTIVEKRLFPNKF